MFVNLILSTGLIYFPYLGILIPGTFLSHNRILKCENVAPQLHSRGPSRI